jgi:hypothetical protein
MLSHHNSFFYFLFFGFLIILTFIINKIDSTELGINPSLIEFNINNKNYTCKNLSVYTDKDIISYKIAYSKEKSFNIFYYNLSKDNLNLSQSIKEYLIGNKRIFEICLKDNLIDKELNEYKNRMYYGIFLINVNNLNLASRLIINKTYYLNEGIIKDNKRFITGKIINENKNLNYSNEKFVLFLLIIQNFLIIYLLFLLKRYSKIKKQTFK